MSGDAEDARYCGACGAVLTLGSRFCGACGSAAGPSPAAAVAEADVAVQAEPRPAVSPAEATMPPAAPQVAHALPSSAATSRGRVPRRIRWMSVAGGLAVLAIIAAGATMTRLGSSPPSESAGTAERVPQQAASLASPGAGTASSGALGVASPFSTPTGTAATPGAANSPAAAGECPAFDVEVIFSPRFPVELTDQPRSHTLRLRLSGPRGATVSGISIATGDGARVAADEILRRYPGASVRSGQSWLNAQGFRSVTLPQLSLQGADHDLDLQLVTRTVSEYADVYRPSGWRWGDFVSAPYTSTGISSVAYTATYDGATYRVTRQVQPGTGLTCTRQSR